VKALVPALGLLALAAPAAAAQRGRPDTVVLKDRQILEGRIEKDDLNEVHLKPAQGPLRKLKAEEVKLVQYGGAPPDFNSGVQAAEAGRFKSALDSIQKSIEAAKTITEDQTKTVTKRKYPEYDPPDEKWWKPYSTYYEALALRMNRSYESASERYETILKNHKDFRLVREAYLGAMRAAIDRAEPDEAKAKEILEAARAERARLGERVLGELELCQIELYMRTEKYAEAAPLYERLAASSDEATALQGVRGVLSCKRKAGEDPSAYCVGLIGTAKSPKIKMIASAALGEFLRGRADGSGAAKDYHEAVKALVDAVLVYYPGRGAGTDQDHEDALLSLAACYEGMAKKAATPKAARPYWRMAAKTYQELLAAHESSPRADEAARRQTEAEAQAPTESP
jgi:tetratricopeptide (TPR) repeat protein